jgi:hypothetical protein
MRQVPTKIRRQYHGDYLQATLATQVGRKGFEDIASILGTRLESLCQMHSLQHGVIGVFDRKRCGRCDKESIIHTRMIHIMDGSGDKGREELHGCKSWCLELSKEEVYIPHH